MIVKVAYEGEDMDLLRAYMDRQLNLTHPDTGLTALHVAVGRNNLEMVKALVEAGAEFVPDKEGRMPSYIAAELEVSGELQDYIVEQEAARYTAD